MGAVGHAMRIAPAGFQRRCVFVRGKRTRDSLDSRNAYGRAVPERDRTAMVSPLLMVPSMFTSERKLVASAA